MPDIFAWLDESNSSAAPRHHCTDREESPYGTAFTAVTSFVGSIPVRLRKLQGLFGTVQILDHRKFNNFWYAYQNHPLVLCRHTQDPCINKANRRGAHPDINYVLPQMMSLHKPPLLLSHTLVVSGLCSGWSG